MHFRNFVTFILILVNKKARKLINCNYLISFIHFFPLILTVKLLESMCSLLYPLFPLLSAGVEETNLEVADLSCLNWLDSCNRTPS